MVLAGLRLNPTEQPDLTRKGCLGAWVDQTTVRASGPLVEPLRLEGHTACLRRHLAEESAGRIGHAHVIAEARRFVWVARDAGATKEARNILLHR